MALNRTVASCSRTTATIVQEFLGGRRVTLHFSMCEEVRWRKTRGISTPWLHLLEVIACARMSLVQKSAVPTNLASVAVVWGRLVKTTKPVAELDAAVRGLTEQRLSARAKKSLVPLHLNVGVIDAGGGLAGVGFVAARAPRHFAEFMNVASASSPRRQVGVDALDLGSWGPDEGDSKTVEAGIDAVVRLGAEVTPPPRDANWPVEAPSDDEPSCLLVGTGSLVYGYRLETEGSTYQTGRVITLRSRFDDDVVRVVGIAVAQSSAGLPVHLGFFANDEWLAQAKAELVQVLDRPIAPSWWLVSGEG